MCAFPIPYAVPGRPHGSSLNPGLIRSSTTTPSSDLPSLSFQSLTNCPRFATHFESPSFQRVTNCPICKPFVLITIQQYPGWVGGAGYAEVKVILELHESQITDHESLTLLECAVPRFRDVTPLECAVTKMASHKSFRMRSYKKRVGGRVPLQFRFSIFDFRAQEAEVRP